MMTAKDNLLRTFDTVYKAAVAARNAGRYNKAKRDFYRAAELMTELAKMSGDKLKAARVDRAKRIIAIADGLPQSDPVKPQQRGGGQSVDDDVCGDKFCTSEIPDTTFDDVIGLDDAKNALRVKIIYPMEHGDASPIYAVNKSDDELLAMFEMQEQYDSENEFDADVAGAPEKAGKRAELEQ